MLANQELINLFKASPIATILLQPNAPNFTIVEVNDAYLKAANTTKATLIGKNFFELFLHNNTDTKADVVKNVSLSLEAVVSTKQLHTIHAKQYFFDDKYFKIQNIPLLNELGEITFIVQYLMLHDTTQELKEREQKEFEKLNKEALINSTTDLIWSVSKDFKLIAANIPFINTLKIYTGKDIAPGYEFRKKFFQKHLLRFGKSCILKLYQEIHSHKN